jgi:HEAT repeat protein
MSSPKLAPVLSPAERERVERIDLEVAAGTTSIAELVGQLAEPSWAVRRAVVAALASLRDRAVAPLVAVLTGDRRNETVLAAAVDALVASTGQVEEALAALAGGARADVLADVAQVLGRRQSRAALPTLIALTAHPNDNVAVAAIEALARVGGRGAIEPLIAAVGSGNFFRVFPAIDVLGRSGDPRVVEPLAALLGNRHYALEVARALGRTGDRSAVAPLAGLLLAGNTGDVRVAAVALAELRVRYLRRFGAAEPIDEALRAAASGRGVSRRLGQALDSAEPAEKIAIAGVLGMLRDEGAVPLLTRMLAEPAEGVAAAAAEALRALGREYQQSLAEVIQQGDSARRKLLLPLISSGAAAATVAGCLEDPDAEVRAAACDALARIGNPAFVAALFKRLEDPNPAVVQSAVGAIQSLGAKETEGLALKAARASSPAVRRWGLRILAYFGSVAALEVCLESLQHEDARVRDSALYGLAFIDDLRAREALYEVTRDPVPRTRASAVRALGQVPDDVRAQAALMRALSDPDAWVRYYACQSLGRLGAEAAAESIARLLADEAGQVRVSAVEALAHFRSQVAHDALVKAATAEDDDVRRAALVGLGIARRADALPPLMAAVRSPEVATRLVALAALAGFEDPVVTEVIGHAAEDDDEGVRNAAIGFLAGRRGVDATARLVELLRRSPGTPRLHQALALASADRINGLERALQVADDELAPLLTSALARMARPEATAALIGTMASPHLPARKATAMTLAGVATREALETLRAGAAGDPDPEVRRICALVLA